MAIKEDSATRVWQLNGLEANSLSLAPNGTIMMAEGHSVLLFTQEGHPILEYQFREMKIINDLMWFQGYLMVLHPLAEEVFITAVEAPCPAKSTLPEGQVYYFFCNVLFFRSFAYFWVCFFVGLSLQKIHFVAIEMTLEKFFKFRLSSVSRYFFILICVGTVELNAFFSFCRLVYR